MSSQFVWRDLQSSQQCVAALSVYGHWCQREVRVSLVKAPDWV